MIIYVGLNIYSVSLYEMKFNLNHFSVILHVYVLTILQSGWCVRIMRWWCSNLGK